MVRTIIVRRNYLHFVKKYQRLVREEAFKHCSSRIPMLPCERGRLHNCWPVQAVVKDGEIQCLESDSGRVFWWRKESIYRSL
ncbi:hypothetical protein RJ640_015080, partial [Escallonia rubra]